jgi:hypothetical protein
MIVSSCGNAEEPSPANEPKAAAAEDFKNVRRSTSLIVARETCERPSLPMRAQPVPKNLLILKIADSEIKAESLKPLYAGCYL